MRGKGNHRRDVSASLKGNQVTASVVNRARVEVLKPDLFGHITDPILLELYRYWFEKRGNRIAPCRREIAPEEIVELLPYICIMDVVWPHPRFYIRLCGTKVVQGFGEEITGRFVEDLDLDGAKFPILAQLEQVAKSACPMVSRWSYTRGSGRYLWYEHLILPLFVHSDEQIEQLFIGANIRGLESTTRSMG